MHLGSYILGLNFEVLADIALRKADPLGLLCEGGNEAMPRNTRTLVVSVTSTPFLLLSNSSAGRCWRVRESMCSSGRPVITTVSQGPSPWSCGRAGVPVPIPTDPYHNTAPLIDPYVEAESLWKMKEAKQSDDLPLTIFCEETQTGWGCLPQLETRGCNEAHTRWTSKGVVWSWGGTFYVWLVQLKHRGRVTKYGRQFLAWG